MEAENYLSIINPHTVLVDVPAGSKAEVFDYAAKALLADGVLTDAEDFKKDLYYRESLGPTGIGGGIAIPHGKSGAVARTCISILKLAQPIQWETADGQPVQVIILFAVSLADKNNTFLRMMAQVARKLAREGVCAQLVAAASPEELTQALA